MRYQLTAFQKDLLLIVSAGLQGGRYSLTFISSWMPQPSGDQLSIFDRPSSVVNEEWISVWSTMSRGDFNILLNYGFIEYLGVGELYGFVPRVIITAVKTDFGMHVLDAPTRRLYLSYASKDKLVLLELVELLRIVYDDIWYDDKLRSGNDWEIIVKEHIAHCSDFIFLLSHNSLASEWCHSEYEEAYRLSRNLITVVLTAGIKIPNWITHQHITPLYTRDAKSLAYIFAALIKHQGI